MWNSEEMKTKAIQCTTKTYLQDVPEDDLEPESVPITIFSSLSTLKARSSHELPDLLWKMETVKCTRSVWMEDVFSYDCDSDESLSPRFVAQILFQSGSNPRPLAVRKYISGNLNRENLVISFWINSVSSSHDSFRVDDHGDLLRSTESLNINNNSDDKATMRLQTSDKAPTKNRPSKSEHTVSSNAKHSYKSRRRYRNTDQVSQLPAVQYQGPQAQARDARAPSAEAKHNRAPSAEAIDARAPSAEAIDERAPSAEAIDARAPSAEAKDARAPSAEAIDARAPTAEAIDAWAPSAKAIDAHVPEDLDLQEVDLNHHDDAILSHRVIASEEKSTNSLRIQRKKTIRDLCVEISKYRRASEVPQMVKNQIFEEFFTPFLNGGFDPEVSVFLNMSSHPGVMSDSVVHDGNSQLVDEISTPGLLDKKGSALSQNVNPGLYGVAAANPAFNPSEMLIFTHEADAGLEESPINQALQNNSLEAETDDNPVEQFSLGQRKQQNVFSGFNTDTYTPESSADFFINKTPFSSEEVHKSFFGTPFAMSREFRLLQPPTLPSRKIKILTEEDGSDCILGKGCFGQVAEAEMKVYPDTVQQVVVKEHFLDKSTQAHIITEAKILMYLESTGCVPVCYGLLLDERGFWGMVSELFGTGVTLHDLLYENNVSELDWYEISHQLATCIYKIHSMYVLINDLKADNVLVDCSGPLPVVKICDMGSASHGAGVTFNDPNMDRFYHLAPEVRAFNLTSSANDVYGLGQILKKIYQASSLSAFKSIYEQCLIENPKERITMSNLLQLLSEAYTKELEAYESEAKALDEAAGSREINGSKTEVEGRENGEDGVEDGGDEEAEIESWDVERPCEIPYQPTNLVPIHKSTSREIILFKPAQDALSVQTHGIPLQKTTSREIMLFKPLYGVSASLQNSQFLNRDTSREKFQTTLYIEQHELSAGYPREESDAKFDTPDVHSVFETANDNLTTKSHANLASEFCDVDNLAAKTLDAKHPDARSPALEAPFAKSSSSKSPVIESPDTESSAFESPVVESHITESSASDSANVLSADTKSSNAKTPVAKTTASEPPASQSPDAESPTSESVDTESVDTESRDAESRDVESSVWFRCVRPLLLALPVAVTAYVLYKASR